MRKLVGAAALALMTAALPTGLGAATSQAATTTWTVRPGGPISSPGISMTLWDVTTNWQLPCMFDPPAPSGFTGSLQSGSGLNGAGIGTLTSVALGHCGAAQNTAWRLNALVYHPIKGITSGTITKIHLVGGGSGCSFVLDGTSDTAHNGKVRFNYYPRTGNLHTDSSTGGTLHFYDVNCPLNPIHSGDAVNMTGIFHNITPVQTITSP